MDTRKRYSIRLKQATMANELKLAPDTKQIFSAGFPGQGFLGLLDIETGVITLTPCFQAKDGLLRPATDYIESKATRGTKPVKGPLIRAAQYHGIAGDDLERVFTGKLIGFGVWKAGKPLRIIDAFVEKGPKNYTSDEYILEKKSFHGRVEWKLFAVGMDLHKYQVSIDRMTGLRAALEEYEKTKDRAPLDKLFAELPASQPDSDEPKIKFIKLSSSSMNERAFEHDDLYLWNFFVRHASHFDHAIDVKREVPFTYSAHILRELNRSLDLNEPLFASDNPQDIFKTQLVHPITIAHWQYHTLWEGLDEQGEIDEIRSNLAALFNFDKIALKGHVRYFAKLWEERAHNGFLERCEAIPFLIFIAAFASGDEAAKKYFRDHHERFYQTHAVNLLQLEEGFKKPLPIAINSALSVSNDEFFNLVKKNYTHTVLHVLDAAHPRVDIKIQDENSLSPLMAAIKAGNLDMIRLLLRYDQTCANFETDFYHPLETAIVERRNDFVIMLLEKDADANARNTEGNPMLFIAALDLHQFEIAQSLLDYGADINARSREDNRTLLMKAAEADDLALAEFLLDRDAEIILKDNDGNTALALAKSEKMRALIQEKWNKRMAKQGMSNTSLSPRLHSQKQSISVDTSSGPSPRATPLKKA